MPDDILNRGEPDRSKINMSEDYEVQYWAKHLGVSKEKLAQVVEKVGNSAAAVRKELAA
jgi:3-oxoacyl-[acyl-carrier-protein] synthase III